jgi:hypothetical protein
MINKHENITVVLIGMMSVILDESCQGYRATQNTLGRERRKTLKNEAIFVALPSSAHTTDVIKRQGNSQF